MDAASTTDGRERLLIAGVGYSYLRDGSVGPVLVRRLAARPWPDGVSVEDYGFGAVDAMHRLRDGGFDRAVFFGSVARGRPPGTVRRYAWGRRPLEPREVQARVAEAAQAVIDLEGTLVVCAYFGALPEKTVVFEVEPLDLGFGEGFTSEVVRGMSRLEAMVEQEVRRCRGE